MKKAIICGIAAFTVGLAGAAVGLATPASADYDPSGYVDALDAAGLIDDDGDHCNIINGLCHGQFGTRRFVGLSVVWAVVQGDGADRFGLLAV